MKCECERLVYGRCHFYAECRCTLAKSRLSVDDDDDCYCSSPSGRYNVTDVQFLAKSVCVSVYVTRAEAIVRLSEFQAGTNSQHTTLIES